MGITTLPKESGERMKEPIRSGADTEGFSPDCIELINEILEKYLDNRYSGYPLMTKIAHALVFMDDIITGRKQDIKNGARK